MSSTASIAAAQVALGTALTDAGRTQESTHILEEALHALDRSGDFTSITRATAYCYLGENAYFLLPANDPTAVQQFSEGLRIIQTYHPDDPLRITAMLGLARAVEYAGKFDDAEAHYRQGLAFALAPGDDHRLDAAGAYQQLGDLLRKRQRFDEAEGELRSAVATYTAAAGADNPWTASAQQDLAKLLADTGRRSEAEKLLTDALQTLVKARGTNDKELVPHLLIDLGSLQFERGEFEAAAESLKTSIDTIPAEDNSHAIALARYGQTLLAQGRLVEATPILDEAATAIARVNGQKSGSYARVRLTQGELWFASGESPRAQAVFNEVLVGWPVTGDTVPSQHVQAAADLMQLEILAGHPADAANVGESLLARIQSLPQAKVLIDYEARIRLWLGEARRLEGKPEAALPHLQSAVSLRERLDDPQSPVLARARIALANCLIDLHRLADASVLLDAAASSFAQHPHLAAGFTAPLAATRARLHPS